MSPSNRDSHLASYRQVFDTRQTPATKAQEEDTNSYWQCESMISLPCLFANETENRTGWLVRFFLGVDRNESNGLFCDSASCDHAVCDSARHCMSDSESVAIGFVCD